VNCSISAFLTIRTPFSSCPAWYHQSKSSPGRLTSVQALRRNGPADSCAAGFSSRE
jgi:hypothetical protein